LRLNYDTTLTGDLGQGLSKVKDFIDHQGNLLVDSLKTSEL
jgi:hypothetical protein